MNRKALVWLVAIALIALLAWFVVGLFSTENTVEAPTDSELPVKGAEVTPNRQTYETKNVYYKGIVQPAGINVYQEGTHKLMIGDERFVLLESDKDGLLDTFLGQEVEVTGAQRSTETKGTYVLRVERINLTELPANTPIIEETNSGSSINTLSGTVQTATGDLMITEDTDVDSEDTENTDDTSTGDVDISSELLERAKSMALDDPDQTYWTQEYCSTHIDLCMPVHKNWWWKSFGATDEDIWHVEISSQEVLALGEGPLVLRVVRLPQSASPNVETNSETGITTGSRGWNSFSHIEISGPEVLKDHITYLVNHLTQTQEEGTDSVSE